MDDLESRVHALKSSQEAWQRRLWLRLLMRQMTHSTAGAEGLTNRRKSMGELMVPWPTYQYQKLPDSRSFRLLRLLSIDTETRTIYATIRTCNIDDCDPYTALSYTWGQATDSRDAREDIDRLVPRFTLAIADQFDFDEASYDLVRAGDLGQPILTSNIVYSIPINQNLSDFFIHYLSEEMSMPNIRPDYLFWIDALCINQMDATEKARQINLMGDIYANAVFVLVWLGKDDSALGTFVW
jgi:hypothetical protein